MNINLQRVNQQKNLIEEFKVMIFEDAHYYDSNHDVEHQETDNHDMMLQQLKMLATVQEAKVYAAFSTDWKAQLDPQVRQWMTKVKQNYVETQQKCKKMVSNTQFETLSVDNQTAEIQLDDYFQL